LNNTGYYKIETIEYHKDVPDENNGSERAIRMIKVKTKISLHYMP